MSIGKVTKHAVIFVLILIAILVFYWLIYRGVQAGKDTPDIIASITQNTISAGLTAVSIVLPITVLILGYSIKEGKGAVEFLFFACIVFTISLSAALWNLFRLPGLVKVLDIASDMKTAFFEVIQLYSLLYGFIYLVIGAWKIMNNCSED
jgi:hypothetical protein